MYDTIIVGKGPAGISAAIYLKRAGYSPLVIGKDGGNIIKNTKIQNYYGIEEITGEELFLRYINCCPIATDFVYIFLKPSPKVSKLITL